MWISCKWFTGEILRIRKRPNGRKKKKKPLRKHVEVPTNKSIKLNLDSSHFKNEQDKNGTCLFLAKNAIFFSFSKMRFFVTLTGYEYTVMEFFSLSNLYTSLSLSLFILGSRFGSLLVEISQNDNVNIFRVLCSNSDETNLDL